MRLNSILKRTPYLWRYADRVAWRGSRPYWEARYSSGGNSGAGSYGRLAQFKAEVLNDFVEVRAVKSVIEFGCGDGNQLSLAKYPSYVGLDVSKSAIEKCTSLFRDDLSKQFFVYFPETFGQHIAEFTADLGLSLDVIYHLVEDDLFYSYMEHLFITSERYIIIYSSNHDEIIPFSHVRHRCFTNHIKKRFPQWRLVEKLENRYSTAQYGDGQGSFADFYFFEHSPSVSALYDTRAANAT
jgi:SAM-dependent methyltransferase